MLKSHLKQVPVLLEPFFVAFVVGGLFYGLFGLAFGFAQARVPALLVIVFVLAFYAVRILAAVGRGSAARGELATQFGTHHRAVFHVPRDRTQTLDLIVSFLENNYKRFKPHQVDRPGHRIVVHNKIKWFDSKNVITFTLSDDGDDGALVEVTSRPRFWIVLFDGGSNARIMNDIEAFMSAHGERRARSSALF